MSVPSETPDAPDSSQLATAPVAPPPSGERAVAAGVGRALHALYDDVIGEDVPESLRALLKQL